MLNGKATIILLIGGLIKKNSMSGYFPIPLGKNVRIVSDLYNYATKED